MRVAFVGWTCLRAGCHAPAVPTARLIAKALGAPLAYLYCEDDRVAALLLELHQLGHAERNRTVQGFVEQLVGSRQ
jgi:hypothetical protein